MLELEQEYGSVTHEINHARFNVLGLYPNYEEDPRYLTVFHEYLEAMKLAEEKVGVAVVVCTLQN